MRRPTLVLVVENNKAADLVFQFAHENPSVAIVAMGNPTRHIIRKLDAWVTKHDDQWLRLKNPNAYTDFVDDTYDY
jgi:hypothetical protein